MGNLNDPRLRLDYSKREHGTVQPDDKRDRFQWVSEVAYKNVHRIVSRGYDTTELVEAGYGLADIIFIDFQARIPLEEESKMLNYVMVLMLEDGLSPTAAISRIVTKSKTLLTQAAGASVLAFGHAYAAYDAFGKMMNAYLEKIDKQELNLAEAAEDMVRNNLHNEALGISGLMLKDPAAGRMLARAEKLGVAGPFISLLQKAEAAAQRLSSEPVAVDMLGATGATMLDLGFSPESTWGVLAVTRAYGSGAHYCEEVEREGTTRLGQNLTPKENYDGPEKRKVPTLDERAKFAKPGQAKTPQEWREMVDERKKVQGSGWAIEEAIEDPRRKI